MSGTGTGSWRFSDRDALEEALKSLNLGSDVYCLNETASHTKGGLRVMRLFAGFRDNRDPAAHSVRCEALVKTLRGHGLKIRVVKHNGRVCGMRLLDRVAL